ncbi:MAG: toxin-antitoxin system YwqK family antitoxin [Tenacibaculum sp.]|nr:toxin-antitoxin system YwqK family antitoxin [Tenacibaculum sp.]
MLSIKKPFIIVLLSVCFLSVSAVAQKINHLDVNGKKTGIWKKFYKNGKLRYKGQFKDGREVGTFKFYENTASTQPVIVKEFKGNKALVKFYDFDGKLKSKGEMIGKKREGKWEYYFSNGKLFSEEFYVNGKLNGILKNYYSNGKITEETEYKEGKKNGVSKIYANDGVLIEETNYLNGVLNGFAKYFDLKGNLIEEGTYNNGRRSNDWMFYDNGNAVKSTKRRIILNKNNKVISPNKNN